MRGLYVVAAVTMAGVSSVFVLLAELEHRYDLPTAGLGWIAGSAFAAALVTQLTLARYADRGPRRAAAARRRRGRRRRAALVRVRRPSCGSSSPPGRCSAPAWG